MIQEKITVKIDPDLEELIPGFLENRSNDVEKLKAACGASDFETLRSIGHSLKGVGGGYGFAMITKLGADIEISAKAGELENIEKCISELSDYLQRIEIQYE